MGHIEPDFRDRVRYTLRHTEYGSLVIEEPEGWRTDEKEIARHKVYHGLFTKFSNSLKFHLSGADYITTVRALYGINAVIQLVKEERDPETDIWERAYDGVFDLSTYEDVDGVVSVKFNSSGIEQDLKARESEKIEIERTTDLNGNTIPNFVPYTTTLYGREIFLRTTFTENDTNDEAHMGVDSNAGNTRNQTVGYPLKLVDKSHEQAHSVIPQTTASETTGAAGMMFFAVSDVDRMLHIKFDINCLLHVQQYENIEWAFYRIQLTRYSGGTNYVPALSTIVYDLGSNHPWFGGEYDNVMPEIFQPAHFSFDQVVYVPAGHSLALEGYGKADMFFDNNAGMRVLMKDFVVNEFSIEEVSHFDTTTAPTVLAHDLASRLMHIITGNTGNFYSEILGRKNIGYQENGDAGWTGFTSGHWVRGFRDDPNNEDNKYKPFTTTFKDLRQALDTTWNIGLGVEREGFKETLRMEPLSYFYSRNILIRLPNPIDSLKTTVAVDKHFSSVEIGYLKGGEYEEAMGLDEYNALNTYITFVTRVKNIFRKVSPYRADAYGKEFARRKPFSLYPTEDTRYDKEIFQMDLKPGNVTLLERLWEDDFDQAPTGVFSPETATNLRYSPFNIMMFKHAWHIASGLTEYPDQYLRFGSSTANSGLTTKLIGKPEYSEKSDIINTDLGRPRFSGDYYEFEHVVDFELNKQIEGKTVILGKEIPNAYGLVEFEYKGKKHYGYLISLKPNGNGKWKLIKAYK